MPATSERSTIGRVLLTGCSGDTGCAAAVELPRGDDAAVRAAVWEDVAETLQVRRELDDRGWEQLVREHRPFGW